MPQTNAEKQRQAYARKQRAWQLIKSRAKQNGYAVTGKDVSGVDEFMDALETGEACIMLFGDDDYTIAKEQLPTLIENAPSSQVRELLEILLSMLPEFDD